MLDRIAARPAAGHAEGHRQRGRRRHLDRLEGGEWRRHQRPPRNAAGDSRRGGAAELPSACAGPQPAGRGETGALGILLPDLTNPVYAATIRGAVRRAEALGYVTLVAEVPDDATSASVYSKLVAERRIDGFIIAVAAQRDLIAAIDVHPVPHVFVNRRATIGRSVTVDDEAAARAGGTNADRGRPHAGSASSAIPTRWTRRGVAAPAFSRSAKEAGLPPVIDAVGPYSRQRRLRGLPGAAQGASRGRPASSRPTCWSASARLPRRARAGCACRRICRS